MKRITGREFLNLGNKKNKRSKYNNKKVVLDNHTFDSIAEANYYSLLKLRRKAKEIKSFCLQPKYLLQEAFEKEGKKYRAIYYVADFEITHNDGAIEVIDVKGTQTQVFRMKEKMFHKKYPHKLTLIKEANNGNFVEIN